MSGRESEATSSFTVLSYCMPELTGSSSTPNRSLISWETLSPFQVLSLWESEL